VFVVCEFQERILIRVANVLLIAEYPPEHIDQFPAVLLHCAEDPPLRLFQRLWDWDIPQQLNADSPASHNFSDY
jgi:hypothetical protein